MTKTVVVVRPQPGNARTATMARAAGLSVIAAPAFAVAPVDWSPPDPTAFDALLLTSANAVRHGGAGLAALQALPVVAVGESTAETARAAGFAVSIVGSEDASAVIAKARDAGLARLLHLAGRERMPTGDGIETRTVYASDPLPVTDTVLRSFEDTVVLLHSPRAARWLGERVDRGGLDRARIAIAALSPAVASAAGDGWQRSASAETPTDAALVRCAAKLAIDRDDRRGDKHGMSDYLPTERPQARGPRLGLLIALIAVAFVAGLGLMAYASKTLPWFGGTGRSSAATTAQQKAGAGNSGYIPALPLNASGEPTAAATPPVDTAVLVTREAALAGQLAALEARAATVTTTAAAAGGQATRAEGMLIAFAARRAIDRGIGLGYLEEQLRLRFGEAQPRATQIVIQAARQPVTIEDLRQGLDTIAPEITTATGDDWLDTVRHQIDNLIVLRRADMPSPMPADRLLRARRLLEGDQVEAARAEVARLPGAAQAGNWLAAARRYVQTRQALDIIENTAILGQAGQPQPAPVIMPAPATVPAPADADPQTQTVTAP